MVVAKMQETPTQKTANPATSSASPVNPQSVQTKAEESEAVTVPKEAEKESDEEQVVAMPNGMWKSPEFITEGSLVILFETYTSLTHCYIKRNDFFQNRHGLFLHNDMIGKRFGSKVFSKNSKGYMYLLAPTPELWSRALRHRTQIVFTLDASTVIFNTQLHAGSVVLESGTGSGALTTAFARTVAPDGHVHTFEFNATRAEIARNEFKRNGLEQLVSIECRDACEQGFPDHLTGQVDVVFLDLPCPWKAIGHANKALKQGGRFASYSPCMEQVQKTCDALREQGFELIKTIETRLVPYSSRRIELPTADFGDTVEEASDDNQPEPQQAISKKRKVNNGDQGDHLVAKKDDEIRGHTAFLTFATKFFA